MSRGAHVFPMARGLAAAALVALVIPGVGLAPQSVVAPASAATPIRVYGAWHCSDDFCTWGTQRSAAAFDAANHWLVDRGDGKPSVNVVVLSFVNPLKLLDGVTDATTVNGIPQGMTPNIVEYFTSRGIRVMVSIGGITYTDAWNQALARDAKALGTAAAEMATYLGVGVEIDYEQNASPNLTGLAEFITAYRTEHPYNVSGSDPTDWLTIDLAAGDRWLIALTERATRDWLPTNALDYANAMVPARQPRSAAEATANWQEHIDGKPKYAPPILALAPSKFTGGLYVALGGKPLPECINYATSLQRSTWPFVDGKGMLGYMFWAAERPSTRGIGTVPPNTCEKGIGLGSKEMGLYPAP
jgi:hypothetical protein